MLCDVILTFITISTTLALAIFGLTYVIPLQAGYDNLSKRTLRRDWDQAPLVGIRLQEEKCDWRNNWENYSIPLLTHVVEGLQGLPPIAVNKVNGKYLCGKARKISDGKVAGRSSLKDATYMQQTQVDSTGQCPVNST